MEISRIRIHNYRSIKDLDIVCDSFVVLLGENNCGKSNILSAVEFALVSSAKPEPEDLFAFRDAGDDSIWVELTFTKLTEVEKTTFSKYRLSDDTIRIRKTATWGATGGPSITYQGYVDEPTVDWLRADRAGEFSSRAAVQETGLQPYLPSSGRLTRALIEEAQRQYIEDYRSNIEFKLSLEESPLFGQRNVAAGLLPDFYLIPAVRDLDDETKVKSTTVFGKLLSRTIEEMAAKNERFAGIRTELESLVKSFNKDANDDQRPQQLAELETNLEQELISWGVEVSIQINPVDVSKIFEMGTDLYLNDGHNTVAQKKGHGLQRAVIFGLMKAWAKTLRYENTAPQSSTRRASESIIFVIEEPELFLHPQAQRSLSNALRELASTDNHQIFLCSHSPHFVDLDHYHDIVIVSKPSAQEGTQARQCLQELFAGSDIDDRKRRFHMAYWVNPDRGEMFFAKKVVFVEGETEKTLLPFLAAKLNCYDPAISIIDCGSKYNLPLYIIIARAFELDYHVIHDEDSLPMPIPTDWNEQKRREKQRTYDLNQEIASLVGDPSRISVCCGDFEGLCGVSKKQGERKGKALAALEYFQGLDVAEFPAELVSIVRAVYSVPSLHTC